MNRTKRTRKKGKSKKGFRITKTIFLVLFFLCGLCLALYPFLSDIYLDIKQSNAVDAYQSLVAELSETDKEDILKKAQEYNQSGSTDGYYNVLNFGETMCVLEVESINVKLPVYHGTSKNVLDFALGHLETSSLPVGGIGTHCVITGHTGLTRVRIFDELDKVKLGDTIKIHLLDTVLVYEVDEINVVLPTDTEKLEKVAGRDLITLVTCTPYGINTHRLLVRGTRVGVETPATDEEPATVQSGEATAETNDSAAVVLPDTLEQSNSGYDSNYAAIALILLLGIFIVILILLPGKKKKKKKPSEDGREE